MRCPHEAGGQDEVSFRGPATGSMGTDMGTGFSHGPVSSKSYLHAHHPVCACSLNSLCFYSFVTGCRWVCSLLMFVFSG